jgi:hypothetical protein
VENPVSFAHLMDTLAMVGDSPAPSHDALHFSRYVEPLVQVITNVSTETPFTLGIFGRWGSGKTSLMHMIAAELPKSSPAGKEYTVVWFNPWLYQSEDNLIIPLLHTIRDTLQESAVAKVKDAAKMVGTIIAQISASALIKQLSGGSLSFEDIEKRVKAYLDKRGETLSTIRTLRRQLQGVVNSLTNDGQEGRLILFIDDLDRCVPTKIVGLLEAIKLFLDLNHTVLFLAIDREIVQRGIQAYYKDLKVEQSEVSTLTADYLDKMIQLPFYLHPLGPKQIAEYLKDVSEAPDLVAQSAIFCNALQPNPRKIKRVLNIYRLYAAVMDRAFPKPANAEEGVARKAILAKMIVLQQQWGELYGQISANPELAGALERVYRGKLRLDRPEDWTYLKDPKTVLELCKKYYLPASELASLFSTGQSFEGVTLAEYLYMLG